MLIDSIKNQTIRKFYLLKLWWDKKDGFLHQSGWIRSFQEKKCVDAQGNPVPWLTYALNQILDQRLKKEAVVYEFGSGYSTLFFAKRVKHVYTVEYDRKWYEWLTNILPANTSIYFNEQDSPEYVDGILKQQEQFDLIVIDGRRRNKCAANALQKISSTGIIIFDDTHREKYQVGTALIEKEGFKRLDFWGFVNGSVDLKCSSVFYRQENLLDI